MTKKISVRKDNKDDINQIMEDNRQSLLCEITL